MFTRRTIIAAGLAVGVLLSALDTSIVGTAMPTIAAGLGGTELYAWVFASYMLTFTTASPIFGKLSDIYGQKALYAISVGLFLVGSALCGGAQTMTQLIAFRAVQGIGGGGLMAMALTIIGHVFQPTERARMQAVISSVWAVAAIVGPLMGGVIIDSLGWRWVFLVNIPLGLIPVALMMTSLNDVRFHRGNAAIDCIGAICLICSILALLFALLLGDSVGWASVTILTLFAASALLLLLFVWNESVAKEPIVPLSLFRIRAFSICNVENMLVGAALFGTTGFIPLFVQGVLRGSATVAGMAVMPMSVAWTLGSAIAGRFLNRLGYRKMAIAGFAGMVAGFYLLASINPNSTVLLVGLDMFIVGLGMGVLAPTLMVAVQNAVPREHMGVASSSIAFYRNIGGAVGVAALGAVLNTQMGTWTSRLLDGSEIGSLAGPVSINPRDSQVLLSPELSAQLSQTIVLALERALSNSLHAVFTAALAVLLIGLVVSILVPDSTPERDEERINQGSPSLPGRK